MKLEQLIKRQKLIALKSDTPDLSCRIKETQKEFGCSHDTALDFLATKRLFLYQNEGVITDKELHARFKQARVVDASF
jgi:hypothetical protein